MSGSVPLVGRWEKAGSPDPFERYTPAMWPVGKGVAIWGGNIPGLGPATDGYLYTHTGGSWSELAISPFANLEESHSQRACVVDGDALVLYKRRSDWRRDSGPALGAWWKGDSHTWSTELELAFSERFALAAEAVSAAVVVAVPGSLRAVDRNNQVEELPWPQRIDPSAAVSLSKTADNAVLVVDVDPRSSTWGACGLLDVSSGAWADLPPTPLPDTPRDPVDRRWCVGDGKEFLVAGAGSAAAARLVLSEERWVEAAPAPCPHATIGTGYAKGWAIASGGNWVRGIKPFSALLYSFADDAWAFAPEDFVPGGGPTATAGDRLWVWSNMQETDARLAELVLPERVDS